MPPFSSKSEQAPNIQPLPVGLYKNTFGNHSYLAAAGQMIVFNHL